MRTYATVAPSLTPRESLKDSQAGQTYYWFVRPCATVRSCGPLGDPTNAFDFTETFLKQSAPVQPVAHVAGTTSLPAGWPTEPCARPSRVEGEVVVSDQVTLCWEDYLTSSQRILSAAEGKVSEQEAKSYKVQVSTAGDFSTTLDSVEVDQATYTAALKTYPEGPIYWRVQAVDGSGNALTWSDTFVLRKSSPAPGAKSPASRATVGAVPTFSWAPQPFAANYEVEVYKNANSDPTSTDNNYASINRVITAKTAQAAYAPVATLVPGTYAWRFRRLDADARPGPWQQGTTATPLVFTVRPAAPSLSAPTSGASVAPADVLFSWQATAGAAAYRFESSASSSFSSLKERTDTVSLAWAPTNLYAAGTYYWRVSALDGSGNVLATSSTWSVNVATTSTPSPSPSPTPTPTPTPTPPTGTLVGAAYRPVAPNRLVNTTTGLGGGVLATNTARIVQVTGKAGIPASGVTAVTLNVAVTRPTAAGNLTVYREGSTRPATPSVAFSASQTASGLVQVAVGSTGKIAIYNGSAGSSHVMVDVLGWFTTPEEARKSVAGTFTPLNPAVIYDTRKAKVPLAAGSTTTVPVLGTGGVPPTGVGSVVVNLVGSGSSAAGSMVTYAGTTRPGTASLHFAAKQNVANRAVVPVGSDGSIRIHTSAASHLAVEVAGWYASTTATVPGAYYVPATTPKRVADSRSGGVAPDTAWGAGVARNVQLTGRGGVPAATASPAPVAVVYGLSGFRGTVASSLTAYPTGTARPAVRDVMFPVTKAARNLTFAKLGTGGMTTIYNAAGSAHVSMDVFGWYVK